MSEHPIIPQFLGGSEQRGGWQKLPLFKRDTLPPTTWLGTATTFPSMMSRVTDVDCFQWNCWKPHREYWNWIWNRTPTCLRHQVWLYVSTFDNVCLPPNQESLSWSLFVRFHKFLFGEIRLSSFFKRVTSYFSTKPGSIETNPTLVVEVSNVKLISI